MESNDQPTIVHEGVYTVETGGSRKVTMSYDYRQLSNGLYQINCQDTNLSDWETVAFLPTNANILR